MLVFWIIQNLYNFVFGPQHPAAHGVLLIILYFSGEFILYCDINIGFLHRGTEKLCEFNSIEQCLPYFDRLDYVSVLSNEHIFSLSFENLLSCVLTMRLLVNSLLLVEFTRCFNGLLCITCMLLDLGSLSPLLWSFEERDKIMTVYDLCCGTRMHLSYIVLLGILDDISFGCLDFIYSIINSTMFFIDLLDFCCINNILFYLRLRGFAILDIYDVFLNSISGCLSSSLGLVWDCSLYSCYDIYFLMYYDYCYCFTGDSYDSFFISLYDMSMSLYIMNQLFFTYFFSTGFVSLFDYFYNDLMIDTIISLFYSIWCCCLPGLSVAIVEHPKGEYVLFVCFLLCTCARLSLRCADFIHILLVDIFMSGYLLHDLCAILGNIDIVFGSVDR